MEGLLRGQFEDLNGDFAQFQSTSFRGLISAAFESGIDMQGTLLWRHLSRECRSTIKPISVFP